MAKSVRSRRTTIAAGALSFALVAPFVTPVIGTPVAQAVEASAFDTRYTTDNFWGVDEAVVQGLELEPGDKVESPTKTIFNWTFQNDNGTLLLIRPQSQSAFNTGDVDIRVKVTPAGGTAYTTTLKVNVVDQAPEPTTTTSAPVTSSPEAIEAPATTTTSATEPTSTSTSSQTTAATFSDRFPTANFWNQQEATIEGLTLEPGDTVAATTNTIFNWKFRNDNGTLTLIRPQSAAAFSEGDKDIPVRVTPADGAPFTTTLKVTVVDEAPPAAWEGDLPELEARKVVDFKQTRSMPVDEWTVPEGVSVKKQVGTQAIGAVGWDVAVEGGKLVVKAPGTFTDGDAVDIPVEFSDANGSVVKRTVRITAKNPQTTGSDIASTVGKVVGAIIGGATGTGNIGDALGGLLGGGSGSDSGSGSGSGRLGGLVGNIIGGLGGTNPDGTKKGLLEGAVKVEVQPSAVVVNPTIEIKPSAVVVTGNANPTVNISDNGSNNGNNNSAVITGNANPVITGNANPVITGNANPTVNISDNGSNNGNNNSAVITGNANPVITGNANPVITGNANPVITGNGDADKFLECIWGTLSRCYALSACRCSAMVVYPSPSVDFNRL